MTGSDKEINRAYAKMSDGIIEGLLNSFNFYIVLCPGYLSTQFTSVIHIGHCKLLEKLAHFRQNGVAAASFGFVSDP